MAARDVDGVCCRRLTSNGDTILYTIIPPAFQGDPVYLVGYTARSRCREDQTDPSVVFWVSLSDLKRAASRCSNCAVRSIIRRRSAVSCPAAESLHSIDLTFSFNAFDSDGDGVTGDFHDPGRCGGRDLSLRLQLSRPSTIRRWRAACSSISMTARIPRGQTVAADTATDLDGVSPKVIGLDNVGRRRRMPSAPTARDIIIGGDEGNVLDGYGGDDLIRGGDGDDEIYGGDRSNDTIYGGGGLDDAILGDGGAD